MTEVESNCEVTLSFGNFEVDFLNKLADISQPDFYNPSTEHSMKSSDFLSHLEIKFKPRNYNPRKTHFHFSAESMLKLIIYKRLKNIRWNSVLAERLKHNVNGCADLLGFNNKTPSRETIGKFFNHHLDVEGHQNLYDNLINRLRRESEYRGIEFGKRVGVDSTPLPVMKNDDTGEINGHYFETFGIFKMVKVHILTCLDTGIPIAVTFSGANEYDGHYLISLIEKAKSLGFEIEECYGDAHYNTFENWSVLSGKHGIKCFFTMPENAKYKQEGSIPQIQKRYQTYRHEADWAMSNDENKMMKYLIEKGDHAYVGGYYKNQWWRTWKHHTDEYYEIKGKKNGVENTNSILKEQLLFEKNIDGKGWKKLQIYTLQFMITFAAIGLIRAENGVKEGLAKISEGVFS